MGIPVITAISVIFYILIALAILPVARILQVFRGRPRGAGRPPAFPLPVLAFLMLIGIFGGGWLIVRLAVVRLAEVLPNIRNLLPRDGDELVLLGIGAASITGTLILVLTAVEILSWFYAERGPVKATCTVDHRLLPTNLIHGGVRSGKQNGKLFRKHDLLTQANSQTCLAAQASNTGLEVQMQRARREGPPCRRQQSRSA